MQIQTIWGFGTKETMARKGGRGYERDLQLKQWRQRGQMRNECLIYQGKAGLLSPCAQRDRVV